MSSWDLHYQSWNNLKVPKLIIKYEDMINHTSNKLNEIFLFLSNNFGFNFNKEALFSNILKSTNFLALQNLEKERGFNEAKDHARFFRKGKTNQWTNILTEDQGQLINDSKCQCKIKGKKFLVHGRINKAEPRGCSDT